MQQVSHPLLKGTDIPSPCSWEKDLSLTERTLLPREQILKLQHHARGELGSILHWQCPEVAAAVLESSHGEGRPCPEDLRV